MIRDLLNQMDRFLVGRTTARDLESWLVSRLQGIIDSGDADSIELANKLDADLIEYSDSVITHGELRNRLQGYLGFYSTVRVNAFGSDRTAFVATSSNDRSIWTCFQEPGPAVRDYRLMAAIG